jgi:hypothetical protein
LAASLALFAVALLGKESGFAALALVPLVVLLARGACDWRRHVRTVVVLTVPFGLVWIALFAARWLVLGSLGGYVNAPVGRFDLHATLNLLTAFTRYLLWAFTGLLAADSRGWLVIAALLFLSVPALAWYFPLRARSLVWFGCAWTLLFVVFFVVVRTLSGAWLLYYPLIGVAFVLAGMLDGARAAWQGRRPVAWLAAAVGALFSASVLVASPLVIAYPEWRIVGDTSQRYVSAVVQCLADAPDGTHVLLDRPPGFLDFANQRNDLLTPVLVTDYTVASALQVAYPERAFRIDDTGFGDVRYPTEIAVTCDGSGNERVVRARY